MKVNYSSKSLLSKNKYHLCFSLSDFDINYNTVQFSIEMKLLIFITTKIMLARNTNIF